MLQNIRDKTSGWVASLVLGLIIVIMALFGIETYLTPKIETFAAKIEAPPAWWASAPHWWPASMLWTSKEISVDEFRQRFDRERQQDRQDKGEAFDAAAFEKVENKRQVLEQLIDEELLKLVAERDGLAVDKVQVQKQIMEIPAFQSDGKFNPDQYRLALQMRGMTAGQLETIIRDGILQNQLPSAIQNSGLASDADVEAYLRIARQTRDLAYVEIPVPGLGATPPGDAELQAWYKDHVASYRSEEKVEAEYVEVDAANLTVPTTADEATLRQRYQDEKSKFATNEERTVSHILIKVPAGAKPEQVESARQKAAALADLARRPGADFAALAKASSEDLGSKDSGGDLGPIEKGLFDPAFEQAVFAMSAGQISDPVRSSEGWHVIQLRSITAGTGKSFEEARPELESEFLEGERERVFSDLTGKLVDLINEDTSALQPAAKKLGLTVYRTGLFTRNNGTGIAALEQVRKVAFADEQKVEGQVSDTIDVEPNHVVVLRVIDHQPVATIPFAQVRDRVYADLIADRLGKAAKAQAEALLARAQKGESLETLAAELGRVVKPELKVQRRAPSPEVQPIVDEAFRLSRPIPGKPGDVALAKLGNDSYALVGVTAVVDGVLADVPVAQRQQLRQQLAMARGVIEAKAFVQGLRKQYTIEVAEDRL